MPEEFDEQNNTKEEKTVPERKMSKFLFEEKKETKQQSLFGVVAVIMSLLLVITGTIASYYYFTNDDSFDFLSFFKKDKSSAKDSPKVKGNFFNRRQNILILGVDSNGQNSDPFESTRSDTILILSINPKIKSANILSIPRDSKVFIAHNNGVQKINAAHAIGGVNLVKDTIEETFGIKINNYIVFNTEGVVQFVDAIDGVPVYVEKDMKYHDFSGKLHVDLTKGTHHLSGKEVEGFLRFRKDALGDIGRTARQQWFLRAIVERVKDPEVIAKIPSALKVAEKYVKSDLSLYQMAQCASYATSIDLSKVEMATMPGAPNKKGYISYWILDPDQCRDVINRLIYNRKVITDGDKLPVAGILYTPQNESQAMKMKSKLEEEGYTVNCFKYRSLPHNQLIGHSSIITNHFIDRLKNTLPELENMQFVYDPTKIYCANSDFTIILSGDK